MITSVQLNDSVLDQPRKGLDPMVWRKIENDQIVLTVDAKQKIIDAVAWLISNYDVDFTAIHLIGSITSNSFTDQSDIDIHICTDNLPGEEDEETFNKRMKQDYWTNYYPMHESELMIGSHPIELYVQRNPYKNMASVGCYDVIADNWIVGPDITDLDFDPYAEYYDDDMKSIKFIIDDIRSQILGVYEDAKVIQNSKDDSFAFQRLIEMKRKLDSSAELFDLIKKSRSILENPTSKEDALTRRASRKWKIADSTFKLLSKFGYIGILSEYSKLAAELDAENPSALNEICQKIIDSLSENLGDSPLDESFKDLLNLGKTAALAGAMLVSPLDGEAARVSDMPFAAKQIQTPSAKSLHSTKMIGNFTRADLINLVAWTIAGESLGESDQGKDAVASVIWNRAGGDATKLAEVIFARKQFSCWNVKNEKGTIPQSSDYYIASEPTSIRNPNVKRAWNKCVELAMQLVDQKFTTTLNYNCYMNKKTADKSNVESWGKLCTDQIGKHHFGYQDAYNGFKQKSLAKTTPTTNLIHVVAKGENLSTIAKKYKTTAKALADKNELTKPDKLKIGQKLKI